MTSIAVAQFSQKPDEWNKMISISKVEKPDTVPGFSAVNVHT